MNIFQPPYLFFCSGEGFPRGTNILVMTSVGNNWDYVVTLTEEQVIKKEYFPPFVISSTSEINIMTKPFS